MAHSPLLHRVMPAAVALAAAAAVATGGAMLTRATESLRVEAVRVGTIPATVYAPPGGARAPVVVIGHGFAGSRQLMQPFAVTLARAGYVAVTFDFAGHGRNLAPMPGGIADDAGRVRTLGDELAEVVAFARALPSGDGRIALLGHSMAADIIAGHARGRTDIAAIVAVSPYLRDPTTDGLSNLLVIVGGLEPDLLRAQASRAIAATTGAEPALGVTTGDVAAGSARRLVVAPGVEHIGVLYGATGLREARDWLDTAFGRASAGALDTRGAALGVLMLGLVALAWPLSKLLPQVVAARAGAAPGWRAFLAVAILPALATPLILWQLPKGFLPILLGDYLAMHFALYGALTWLGIRLLAAGGATRAAAVRWPAFAAAMLAATLYAALALGVPTDLYAMSVAPSLPRLPATLALFAGTLLYFTADEWLTRGPAAPRLAYLATKHCFLGSLAIAIALDLPSLFFLIIIVPAMLLFFGIYGLFSRWTARATGHPFVGAIMNAVVFALAISAVFPLVSR